MNKEHKEKQETDKIEISQEKVEEPTEKNIKENKENKAEEINEKETKNIKANQEEKTDKKQNNSKLSLKILVAVLLIMCILLVIKLYIAERDSSILYNTDQAIKSNTTNDITVVEENETLSKKNLLDSFFLTNIVQKPSYTRMIRFPSSYTGLNIATYGTVKEIVAETDSEMTVKANIDDLEKSNTSNKLVLIKYKKNDNIRLIKEDIIKFVGKFAGIDKDTQIPLIEASKIVLTPKGESDIISTFEEIENIAQNFFGTNITVTKPSYTQEEISANPKLNETHWVIKLNNKPNNQSFSDTYRIYDRTREIEDSENKEGILERSILLTSSLNGYIAIERNVANNRTTIAEYDQNYNQIWQKTWENVMASPYVITKNGKVYIAIKSDIYVLNEKNGEELVTPISVSEEGIIGVDELGNIYYATTQKSGFIMCFDAKGNLKWKNDCPATQKPVEMEKIILEEAELRRKNMDYLRHL